MWFSSGRAIIHYDGVSLRQTFDLAAIGGFGSLQGFDTGDDPRGGLWVSVFPTEFYSAPSNATQGRFLYLDAQGGVEAVAAPDQDMPMEPVTAYKLRGDGDGGLWAASAPGGDTQPRRMTLAHYRPAQGWAMSNVEYHNDCTVLTPVPDGAGGFWTGCAHLSAATPLIHYRDGEITAYSLDFSAWLNEDPAFTGFIMSDPVLDRQGNIWGNLLITNRVYRDYSKHIAGIFRYAPSAGTLELAWRGTTEDASQPLVDGPGNVWSMIYADAFSSVPSDYAPRLFRYGAADASVALIPHAGLPERGKVLHNPAGGLWIVGQSQGGDISYFDGEAYFQTFTSANSLLPDTITDALSDGGNGLWITSNTNNVDYLTHLSFAR